jgi:futalosine hydrolase
MKILIVAATLPEIRPFLDTAKLKNKGKSNIYSGNYLAQQVDILVTGIGMVATTYILTKHLAGNKYDLAINVGIAGSFRKSIGLGEVVQVVEDVFSEMGVEDGEQFMTFDNFDTRAKMNGSIIEKIVNPYHLKVLPAKGKGITVNTVHGNERTIQEVVKRLDPDVESMEGAAFLHVCKMEKLKCIQLRAISNFVEERSKANWNIKLAVSNLNALLIDLFNSNFH